MNGLQTPSALKDEPVDEEVFRAPETVAEGADSLDTWLLVVSGSLAAALVAGLLSQFPQPHRLSWSILVLSAGFLTLTAAAGFVGMWIPWYFFGAKASFRPRFLSSHVAVGWVFLPCIILLYRRQSRWMFLVVSLATLAVAFSLRRLLQSAVEADQSGLSNRQTTDLPALYGLPIADFQPLRAFFIALCAQATLILAIVGYLWLASVLLSTCLFLLVWRWTAFDRSVLRRFTGRKPPVLLCAFALLLTILVLIPAIGDTLHGAFGQNDLPHKPPTIAHQPAEPDKPSSDYVGIVLWPPPIKKEIIPPLPRDRSFAIGGAAKPVVIPFDGPYWYFKAPSRRPGPHAHIAHGKPTDVNVRSSDWAPLLMEAHQNLGTSIDLACCSEIDIALINADARPGKIALGIVLTDSNSIARPVRELGEQIIVSSEADPIPLNRPPVKETLRFPISRSATMRRFNEITVVFLPAKERARGGAKVSIQSFTLIPR
jgi:hypothetical protein